VHVREEFATVPAATAMSAVINHASVYAHEPKRAARLLASLTGGTVEAFHPLR